MNADICAILAGYCPQPAIYRLIAALNVDEYIYYNRRLQESCSYDIYRIRVILANIMLYDGIKYDGRENTDYNNASMLRDNTYYNICNYKKYGNMQIIKNIEDYHNVDVYSKWFAYLSCDNIIYEYCDKGLSGISIERIINIRFYRKSYCIYLYSDCDILTITGKCISIYGDVTDINNIDRMVYDKYTFDRYSESLALYPRTNIPLYIINRDGITLFYKTGRILCHIPYYYSEEMRTYVGKCGNARFFDRDGTKILREYK